METVLQISAPVWGFFLGTFLFSRVGGWIQVIATALQNRRGDTGLKIVPSVAFLHSGPWLLAAVVYWAYHILSAPHAPAWDWFFGGVVTAMPAWVAISIYLYRRSKRLGAERAKGTHAV
jgi:hypothetical protein